MERFLYRHGAKLFATLGLLSAAFLVVFFTLVANPGNAAVAERVVYLTPAAMFAGVLVIIIALALVLEKLGKFDAEFEAFQQKEARRVNR